MVGVGNINEFIQWLNNLSPEGVSPEIPTKHSWENWNAFVGQAFEAGFSEEEVNEHLKQLYKDGRIKKSGPNFYLD
jgi:hypothetical protein